jgi:GNAT superfamily N-acetyltransferase
LANLLLRGAECVAAARRGYTGRTTLVIHTRPMTLADVPVGMRLKEQAGWNQLEADWRRFLDMEPDGCFVAEQDGMPVGTVTTCVFGPVAWIAMMLVDAAVRGQGIGRALMVHALEFLEGQGVRSVRLDATPLGQPLYEKLGFVAQYQLARFAGTLPAAEAVSGVSAAGADRIERLLQLDRAITATDRRKWACRLFAERSEALRVVERGGETLGFLTVRPGTRALLIGPCLATAEAGPLLFADAWHRYAGRPVFIDIPTGNRPAVERAQAQGLAVQRHLLRMCRGPEVVERTQELWASSGPELG